MEQDLLRIGSAEDADRVTLSLYGELDMSSAPGVMARFARTLHDHPTYLDVDLRRLDSTDSVGLSVFVTAHFQCLDAGISLRFLNPNPFVQELLATTGLEEVLSVTTTDDLVGA